MHSSAPFREAVSVAAASLRSSKLRSFLTLFGIILATTTLIAVMSVVHGMDVYVANTLSDMGTDGFRVSRMPMASGADPKRYLELQRRNPRLMPDEYNFLKEKATLVREIGMEAYSGAPIRYGNDEVRDVQVVGVTANIGVISNKQAAVGRYITDIENRKRSEVVFIGNDIRERFFPNTDPVEKVLYIRGRPFRVVGAARSLGTVFGQSRDNFVQIPIETYFKMYGSRQGVGFSALALSRDHYLAAQDEIRMLLRAYRKLGPTEEDNFGMFGSDSLVAMWDRLTGVIAATATAVVSVFMVVGGVVIMNIMLAVVTERTHEIGIRKAVGARRQDILSQFLVESSMMAACGGLLGVLLAYAIAVVIRNTVGIPMVLPASAVVIGVGLSTLVGLFFGVYPAKRASELDPIEALRFEK